VLVIFDTCHDSSVIGNPKSCMTQNLRVFHQFLKGTAACNEKGEMPDMLVFNFRVLHRACGRAPSYTEDQLVMIIKQLLIKSSYCPMFVVYPKIYYLSIYKSSLHGYLLRARFSLKAKFPVAQVYMSLEF
jgi:hypothetical protein